MINFIKEYTESLKPKYEKLVDEVKYVLRYGFETKDIEVVSIQGRTKSVESLKDKIERKNYTSSLDKVTDLAGIRVVCNFETDLSVVENVIRSSFHIYDTLDKKQALGSDRMGYNGLHFVVYFGEDYSGARYEDIKNLLCEIQVRTVLQDAWAIISHHLIYKEEDSIPVQIKRDLNNVSSLLEIAQGIFDSVREKRKYYLKEIRQKAWNAQDFLDQPIDFDTLWAYTEWKFPDLYVSERTHNLLLRDLNLEKYSSLKDIDNIVEAAQEAVRLYKLENPNVFQSGTGHITKSLGFVDKEFRSKHPFGAKTKEAFSKYKQYVQKISN